MPTKSPMPPPIARTPRPGDATLSVTKAAHVLGVHPNTVRAWSEAGRLRFYRINERGDRRYRLNDLQRFLAAAESAATAAPVEAPAATRGARRDGIQPAAPTLTESPAGLDLLADLAEVASFPSGLDPALDEACKRIRLATGAALVGIWERRPGGLVPRATDVEGPGSRRRAPPRPPAACSRWPSSRPSRSTPGPATSGPAPVLGMGTDELVVRIPGGEEPWGVLVLAGAMELGPDDGVRLAGAIARTLGVLIRGASATEQATSRLRRSEALRRVATDLASRLDVGDVVRDLSDHARVLFGADRVAVVLRDAEGRISSPGGTGFSDAFLAVARDLEEQRAGSRDIPPRRPVLLLGPDAPRTATPIRAAAVQEGVDTLLVAPLVDGHELHGVLYLAHDRAAPLARGRPRRRRGARGRRRDRGPVRADVRPDGGLGGPAPVDPAPGRPAVRADRRRADRARDRHRAAPADRLPQRPRLPRPRHEPRARGDAGPGRRLQRRDGRDLTVAVGEGITGWVARFRVPQLVDDTANDPRAVTIPGTEDDLDESMLLAPMVHEGVCLGVVVLSKLGLRQFTEDDLRLLVIYASFAAQAMANADATAAAAPRSRTRSSASCAPSRSSCARPSRSSPRSTSARCWSRSRSGWAR